MATSRGGGRGAGMAVGLLMGLLPTPSCGSAQFQGPAPLAWVGPAAERYTFSDAEAVGIRSLTLVTLPLGAVLPIGQRVSVEVRGAYARGSMERADGETLEISGLTDTEVRLGYRTAGAVAFQMQAVAMIPTGHSSHTAEEAQVAGAVAADLLPFRISNWGSGGGLGAHTSVARSFGETGAGLSVTYLMGREFEPVDGAPFAYQPGNQLRVRAAVDHNVGPTQKLTLTLTVERHSEDLLDGANLYRAGNRIQGVGSYGFRASQRSSALVYGGVLHRSQGSALLEQLPDVASQQLILAGGGFRLPMGWGVVVPSADARLFRSGDGVGQGWATGLGAAVELRAGKHALVPAARARFGNVVVREGSESGVTGLELSLTARLGR